MKKKFMALMLASAMVMGLGLTASAEDANVIEINADGTEVEVDASVNLPIINITVPTSLDIAINPYQMAYTVSGGDASNDQIVCVPQEISSTSNVAIAVNVKELTAKNVAEGVTVAEAPTTKETGKSVFLYLEAVKGTENFAAGYDKTSKSQVVVPNASGANTRVKAAEKTSIVILDAGTDASPAKAKFKVGGTVVANPTKTVDKVTSDDPWTSADTLKISFKFTFTPQVVATTTP